MRPLNPFPWAFPTIFKIIAARQGKRFFSRRAAILKIVEERILGTRLAGKSYFVKQHRITFLGFIIGSYNDSLSNL